VIFLTVGNATAPFRRLLDAVDQLAGQGLFGNQDVIMQVGNNPDFHPTHAKAEPFLEMNEFVKKVQEADLVICHAGAGTLLHVLCAGKVPVVMPRRRQYGELVDDHQVELVQALASEGKVIPAFELDELEKAITIAQQLSGGSPATTRGRMPALLRHAITDLVKKDLSTDTGLVGDGKTAEGGSFSYQLAKDFYSKRWPSSPMPYLHLERYLRCWLDPELVFSGRRILEIGAGECTYTRLIADQFHPQLIVASELFVERMLPGVRENRNPLLKAIAGDGFRLPFRNCSFDVVFASGVLSELPGVDKVVREIERVLTAGGLFVGWDPNPFNPIILYRYVIKPRSANQYLFWPHKIRDAFQSLGFATTTRFFYAKLPWTRNRFLGTCVGVLATKHSQ